MNDKKSFLLIGNGGGGSGTQVQADWNQSDNTQPDYIKNKPSIPTVNDATITLTQDGVTKGSFTLNQSSNATIDFDAGGTADIPEEELNTVTIWNESSTTTFTKTEWSVGPVVSEIWNNGIKQTTAVTSPYTVAYGINHYLMTGDQNTEWSIANCLELANKYGTYWVFAHRGYNTPMTGDYTSGDCNCVIDLLDSYSQMYNLGSGSTGVKYWFPENRFSEADVTTNNSFILFDKTISGRAGFNGSISSDTDVRCTIYCPSSRVNELKTWLATCFPNIGDINWIYSHIVEYSEIVKSGDYKYEMITLPTFTQEQADWSERYSLSAAYIKNKPTIPDIPPFTTETLTFTLSDQSTVNLTVYVQPTLNFFYLEDASGEGNSFEIATTAREAPMFEVWTSTDQINWTSMGINEHGNNITFSVPANGKIYVKAITNTWSSWFYNHIVAQRSFNVGGNIMSLLVGNNYTGATLDSNYAEQFRNLFEGQNVVDASDLELPSNVSARCYQGMFYGCTSLTQAPALPATTLADGCYQNMFNGASSLDTVVTYANNISATDCLDNWLNDVAVSGDFYNLGTATYTADSASGIPQGWTEHNSI